MTLRLMPNAGHLSCTTRLPEQIIQYTNTNVVSHYFFFFIIILEQKQEIHINKSISWVSSKAPVFWAWQGQVLLSKLNKTLKQVTTLQSVARTSGLKLNWRNPIPLCANTKGQFRDSLVSFHLHCSSTSTHTHTEDCAASSTLCSLG